jgi:hypothetical protein
MKTFAESPESPSAFHSPVRGKEEKRQLVLAELDKILASPFFKSAARSRQFLKYVVQHQIEGHPELLKERTIGTEVFLRPAGYTTGDDPVVRVQAGEVRRRLEQYYQATPNDSTVRIELPVGSYSPVFHWPESSRAAAPPALAAASAFASSSEFTAPAVPATTLSETKDHPKKRGTKFWITVATCSALALAAGIAFVASHRTARQKSVSEQFWAPVFATPQPVIICLAKPVAYRPSQEIYERYSRTHPGTFETEAERSNVPLPLDPNEKLTWGDMFVYSDFGVATGDVYAAITLSALMGRIGKPSQVRIGTNYSFEDLRSSPAVVVGAFNNKWTMQLNANLHYAFVEEHERYMIREQAPSNRVWTTQIGSHGEVTEDFAIVTRLLESKTGQFTITVAGIGPNGTQAAGEFLSNPRYLVDGLQNAPAGWQSKNMEILLQTTVTDSIAGPPHVVAAYFW